MPHSLEIYIVVGIIPIGSLNAKRTSTHLPQKLFLLFLSLSRFLAVDAVGLAQGIAALAVRHGPSLRRRFAAAATPPDAPFYYCLHVQELEVLLFVVILKPIHPARLPVVVDDI